jgi:PEP-CTERM putative exosortase interaction domain/autotransporter-associated beta strand repeat
MIRSLCSFLSLLTLAICLSPHSASAQLVGTGNVSASNAFTNPTWNAGAMLIVQDGTLAINSGGSVHATITFLGYNSGDGVIDVNGGSFTGSQIHMGDSNSSKLIIRNGGSLILAPGSVAQPTGLSLVDVGGAPNIIEVSTGGSLGTGFFFSIGAYNIAGGDKVTISGGSVTSHKVELVSGLVDISGGTWNISDELTLAAAAKPSRLLVRGTAMVSAPTLRSEGLVEVEGGTLTIANSLVIGAESTGAYPLPSERTLTISGGSVSADTVYVGHGNDSNGILNLNGGELTASTVYMSRGTNTSSELNLNGGTLTTGSLWGRNIFSSTPENSVVRLSGGTLRLTGNGEIFNRFEPGNVTLEEGTSYIDTQEYTRSTSYALSGAGRLYKRGSGTLTLTGANTYTGGTTVAAGTLSVTGSIHHPDASLQVAGSGILRISGTGAVTNSNALIGPGEVQVSGGRWTNTGPISLGAFGPGKLTISGGEVTATEVATGYGISDTEVPSTITLTGGILTTGQVVKAATRPATMSFGGGTLRLSGHQSALFSGFAPGSVTLDAGGGTIDTQKFNVTSAQGLSGAGGLVKKGDGTLTLTGENTYTGGTTILNGTLMIGEGTTGSITGDVVNHGGLWFGRTDTHTFEGVVSGTGSVILTQGTAILTGDHHYTGGTHAWGSGTLQLGNGGTTGSVVGDIFLGGGIFGTGHLMVNRSDALTLSGIISGPGTVTQAGTGTLLLDGENTHTGATYVNAGTLVVNGSLADSSVEVRSGAALGGTGTFGGLVTIGSGATLAPGNSPGTITFTEGLTLAGGATLDFELGSLSDLIWITGGTLTGPSDGVVTLNIFDSGDFAAGTYLLFNFEPGVILNSFDLTDFDFGDTIAGYDYTLDFFGSALRLTALAPIPEPSAYAALAGLAALGLVIHRRRRQRTA